MTTRYDILIEANDKASKNIKAINVALTKTDTKASKAAKSVKSMGSSLGKVGFGVAKTGMKSLAAATVAATAAFVIFGTKSINALDELGKLSTKLGVSTKFLSEYAAVADKAGLSSTQFNTGVQRFLRRLGEAQQGAGELLKPLKAMGIAIKDSNGNFRDGTEVFEEYITSLGEMSNAQQALAFATKGFDTEGVAFINIAKMGTDAINKWKQAARDAGLVVDDRLIRAAEDAKDSLSGLTDIAKGFGMQFFGNLADPLKQFANDLKDKINEAVKGAGGMAQFSRELSGKFLLAAADMIDAFEKLFSGVINSFNKATNVLKQVVVSISNIPGAGFNAKFGSAGQNDAELKRLRAYKAELEAIMDSMSIGARLKEGFPGQSKYDAGSISLEWEMTRRAIESLDDATTIWLTKANTDIKIFDGALGDVSDKLKKTGNALLIPLPIVTGVQGGDRTGDAKPGKSATDIKVELALIDQLIKANNKMLPIQQQLADAYKLSTAKIENYNKLLAETVFRNDEQKQSIVDLLAAETTHNAALKSRINMGETANNVYQASTVAIEKLKTRTGDLTKALELENAKTKEMTPFKIALIAAIKENEIAVSRLTGTYVEAKKPMETAEEYLTRIKEAVALASNETDNYNAALLQMQLDLIAGKGNAEELAAAIKYLQEQQTKKTGKLTIAEEATKRLKDLAKEIKFNKELTAELIKRGVSKKQLDALGFGTEKTAFELAENQLLQSRAQVGINEKILEQLTAKYNLTEDEIKLYSNLKVAALTASESIVAGLEQTSIKYKNLEDTINDSTVIEELATRFNTSSAVIKAALIEAFSGIDALIAKNASLLPLPQQLSARYDALTIVIAELNEKLKDGSLATDEQRASLNKLVEAAIKEQNILKSRIEMGETVNRIYEASAGALATLKTKEAELESAISQTTASLKAENVVTAEKKAFLDALEAALEANRIAQAKLTGEYIAAKKPMETLAEFMARITEQGRLATNSSYNLQIAIQRMTADIIAGRGNVLELAAALKILNELQDKSSKSGTLTVAEDAAKRLQALKDEIAYTPQLVAELKKLGTTRAQLQDMGLVDKTAFELAEATLLQSRAQVGINETLLAQLLEKYNITKEEAIAQGLLKEAALTASESMFAGIDANIVKFNELEATINNADAMAGLAIKYGVSVSQIRQHLLDAQEGLNVFKHDTSTIAGNIADVWDTMGKNMAAGISKGIMEGKGLFNSFKGFLKNFANQVITQIIQKMLIQPMINSMMQFGSSLMGGMGGGGMSLGSSLHGTGGMGGGGGIIGSILSAFSGGKAKGGNIPGGTFGLVGENGPEFINGPARITPMNNDINSSEGLTVNFNINAISTSDGTSFILEHKKEITGVIQNAFNKRGKQGIY